MAPQGPSDPVHSVHFPLLLGLLLVFLIMLLAEVHLCALLVYGENLLGKFSRNGLETWIMAARNLTHFFRHNYHTSKPSMYIFIGFGEKCPE